MRERLILCRGRESKKNEDEEMKYTKQILTCLLAYAAVTAAGITAAAKGAETTYPASTVEPVNAVIAAALVLLAGGIIFIRRHR